MLFAAGEGERTELQSGLMDELRRAQAICSALMQAAKLYLEAERARVAVRHPRLSDNSERVPRQAGRSS